MLRIVRPTLAILLSVLVLALIVFQLSPSARRLAPSWLYYDLVARRFAPAPPDVEQFVLVSGQEYCAAGRDSDCGGYKILGVRGMAISQAAQQNGVAAAWCVDYAVLRRNQSRLTGDWIYWANIPRAMVVVRALAGQHDSFATDNCRTATLP